MGDSMGVSTVVASKMLRGGAWATSARIARPAYRKFFTPDHNDVIAGFRMCAL
jgi:iron(II)-dependent oxidoreductase